AAFPGFAEAVAFDRFGQDHRGLADRVDRSLVGGIDFFRIVAAAAKLGEFFVGEMLDEFGQLRILADKLLADVTARSDYVFLILAVHDFAHALDEQARCVLFQERIPIVAPNDFDDIPAGTTEDSLQLLNDFAVTANRTVEALQVAVDDEDQIV